MNDLGINLMFAENVISIGKGKEKDFVPMKSLGMLTDIETSQCIYDMHVQAPILQQEEERQKKLLDANYSKVDIDQMVKDLDISKSLKEKLKYMLNNHKTLFSGGLGKVDMKPINIKLKKGCKPHASRHYSVPKMFEKPFRKEVERLVKADILERISF